MMRRRLAQEETDRHDSAMKIKIVVTKSGITDPLSRALNAMKPPRTMRRGKEEKVSLDFFQRSN